ncbi:MAG TPA: hypothetical protein IAB39_02550 [Candidatus Onthovicinus excrementipullorum]|nr:hypothetical protein [Candidatus Onthovicinus excrementipullorum]
MNHFRQISFHVYCTPCTAKTQEEYIFIKKIEQVYLARLKMGENNIFQIQKTTQGGSRKKWRRAVVRALAAKQAGRAQLFAKRKSSGAIAL